MLTLVCFNRPNVNAYTYSKSEHDEKVECSSDDTFFAELLNEPSFRQTELLGNWLNMHSSLPSDQKTYIAQYLGEAIMASYGTQIEDSSVEKLGKAMIKLGEVGFDLAHLSKCSPKQRESIIKYGSQMLNCGYKTDFTANVCNRMIDLYSYTHTVGNKSETLEDILLYAKVSVDDNGNFVFNSRDVRVAESDKEINGHNPKEKFQVFIEEIENFLTSFMENSGEDYQIVKNYNKGQRDWSWSNPAAIFKGFCLSTRQNLQNESYFLSNPDDAEKIYKDEEILIGEEDDYSDEDEEEDIYKGPFGADGLLENFNKISDKEKYVNTMTTYRAFVAIALSCMDIYRLDNNRLTLKVSRALPDYNDDKQLPGIADSTAFEAHYTPLHYSPTRGYCEMEMYIPICDVFSAFFLNPEFGPDEQEVVCSTKNAVISNVKRGIGKKEGVGKEEEN